ncbi:MAG: hypothetical protein A2202_03075 [Bdellovibrionales bacterium RIFOXYA1_FULL_36_14]|nr:MAG: hypothetical protein A2202_03075 [Bdellovibrionales bacterium RIFOXYA1_FULL_36_14]
MKIVVKVLFFVLVFNQIFALANDSTPKLSTDTCRGLFSKIIQFAFNQDKLQSMYDMTYANYLGKVGDLANSNLAQYCRQDEINLDGLRTEFNSKCTSGCQLEAYGTPSGGKHQKVCEQICEDAFKLFKMFTKCHDENKSKNCIEELEKKAVTGFAHFSKAMDTQKGCLECEESNRIVGKDGKSIGAAVSPAGTQSQTAPVGKK